MITSYLDIISLSDAKTYLRIDDTLSADDTQIETMITAAFQWIEKYTNHILVEQEKEYFPSTDNTYCGQNIFFVYDSPIESVVSPADSADYTEKRFATKVRYTSSDETITLNLGYAAVEDIPQPIIQAAYATLQVWYYNSEKAQNNTLVPDSVRFALNPYRRFPLF